MGIDSPGFRPTRVNGLIQIQKLVSESRNEVHVIKVLRVVDLRYNIQSSLAIVVDRLLIRTRLHEHLSNLQQQSQESKVKLVQCH